MKTLSGKNVLALTDSQISEELKERFVSIKKDGCFCCSGVIRGFYRAEQAEDSNRSIVGIILDNVELTLVDNIEIEVRQ